MRELIITENEAGQRFDKYLKKYMDKSPASFIYKMLRKKNITLNGAKATGAEKLAEGDTVKLFLSDETVEKFSGENLMTGDAASENSRVPGNASPRKKVYDISGDIIYQDDNVLFINKKSGMLSQKAGPEDVSLNELMIDYLLRTGKMDIKSMRAFKPSVCNRLDRNTSGLITCGISLMGLQELSRLFKERGLDKYYITVVSGQVKKPERIEGYLKKDSKSNKVTVYKDIPDEREYEKIKTEYEPVFIGNIGNKKYTVLKVKLITGKTHQIRAHLAGMGYPVIGDMKYGNADVNSFFREEYGVKCQLLHSYELQFNEVSGGLSYLNGKKFNAPMPKIYERFWEKSEKQL